MAKPVKKPYEIPAEPDKPKVKPRKRQQESGLKKTEILPEKEPERIKPFYEIPLPVEE